MIKDDIYLEDRQDLLDTGRRETMVEFREHEEGHAINL
jgi:hypothetical protein